VDDTILSISENKGTELQNIANMGLGEGDEWLHFNKLSLNYSCLYIFVFPFKNIVFAIYFYCSNYLCLEHVVYAPCSKNLCTAASHFSPHDFGWNHK